LSGGALTLRAEPASAWAMVSARLCSSEAPLIGPELMMMVIGLPPPIPPAPNGALGLNAVGVSAPRTSLPA
jgi:hypothetical protein